MTDRPAPLPSVPSGIPIVRGTPDQPIVRRRIFPIDSECDACKWTGYAHAGSSRGGHFRYRQCTRCRAIYRVTPIAEEIDDGGAWSRIRRLA